MSTPLLLKLSLTDEQRSYLMKAAFARETTEISVLRAVIETALDDKLLLSVLDDDDKPSLATRQRKGPRPGQPQRIFPRWRGAGRSKELAE